MANKKQKKILRIDGVEAIPDMVKKYGRIKIINLGFFTLYKYKGKKTTHKGFASKDALVPSHNRLKFNPLKEVKDKIQ